MLTLRFVKDTYGYLTFKTTRGDTIPPISHTQYVLSRLFPLTDKSLK